MKDLRGKVGVVTGGAGGIGKAIGAAFLAEGMKVVLADVLDGPLNAAVEELGSSDVVGIVTDVTSYESLCQTRDEAIERFGTFTLVRARPLSGRTHQIRVHALAAGCPLAVDPLYRPPASAQQGSPPVIERLTLHALALELPADWEGERRFSCEPPEDFSLALTGLRQGAATAGGSSVE